MEMRSKIFYLINFLVCTQLGTLISVMDTQTLVVKNVKSETFDTW